MSKVEQRSSKFLQQVIATIDPEKRDNAAQRVAIAVRIQDDIVSKGISKLDFARLMDKHPSEISKWLSGRHNFTLDTLSAIQRKLNLKLLVTEENKREVSQTSVAVMIIQPAPKLSSNWSDLMRQNGGGYAVTEYLAKKLISAPN